MFDRLTIYGESTPMIHPLLTPRLYCRTDGPMSLPRRREHKRHPLRDYFWRQASRLYRRWGAGLGFIVGLAIAYWLWLPGVLV